MGNNQSEQLQNVVDVDITNVSHIKFLTDYLTEQYKKHSNVYLHGKCIENKKINRNYKYVTFKKTGTIYLIKLTDLSTFLRTQFIIPTILLPSFLYDQYDSYTIIFVNDITVHKQHLQNSAMF
jgi:hypothetical protein